MCPAGYLTQTGTKTSHHKLKASSLQATHVADAAWAAAVAIPAVAAAALCQSIPAFAAVASALYNTHDCPPVLMSPPPPPSAGSSCTLYLFPISFVLSLAPQLDLVRAEEAAAAASHRATEAAAAADAQAASAAGLRERVEGLDARLGAVLADANRREEALQAQV